MSETASNRRLPSLRAVRRVRLRVHYPNQLDQMVLRTDMDWDKDIPPCTVDQCGLFAEFDFELRQPFTYLKPCLCRPSELQWATGPNRLLVATGNAVHDIYPAFHSTGEGKILDVITVSSKLLNRRHSLRVYLPAGYDENTCRGFPVMYMQDGRNLFFPQEAFMAQDWGVKDKLALLNEMNAIQADDYRRYFFG